MRALTVILAGVTLAAALANLAWLVAGAAVGTLMAWTADGERIEREVDAIEQELIDMEREFRKAA